MILKQNVVFITEVIYLQLHLANGNVHCLLKRMAIGHPKPMRKLEMGIFFHGVYFHWYSYYLVF
jgi:hypothetical protein